METKIIKSMKIEDLIRMYLNATFDSTINKLRSLMKGDTKYEELEKISKLIREVKKEKLRATTTVSSLKILIDKINSNHIFRGVSEDLEKFEKNLRNIFKGE